MCIRDRYYRILRRRAGAPGLLTGKDFGVVLGCVFGAALGNKLVFLSLIHI